MLIQKASVGGEAHQAIQKIAAVEYSNDTLALKCVGAVTSQSSGSEPEREILSRGQTDQTRITGK
jgi:hypothetical protein